MNIAGLRMLSTTNHRVAFIVGPTGVGKTALSVEIAKGLDAEIISADSRYLYKGMDIGTAKPLPQQLDAIPHHLINVAEINENWSLAEYKEQALSILGEIIRRGKLPLVVGGTGQYIRALIEGWTIPEKPANPAMRKVLMDMAAQSGSEVLHKQLAILDPEAASKIDQRNVRRTIRALEVILYSGERFSSQRRRVPINFRYKRAGLTRPRKELYQIIDNRIENMIANGFVEEVRGLMERGYTLAHPPMSAIGYKEIVKYIDGDYSLDDCIAEIKKRTRQLVRRQANWFKLEDERIRWFDVDKRTQDAIIEYFQDERGWRS